MAGILEGQPCDGRLRMRWLAFSRDSHAKRWPTAHAMAGVLAGQPCGTCAHQQSHLAFLAGVIAACTHDHVILENRDQHESKTDGAEARQDVFHIRSGATKLVSKLAMKRAIRAQRKGGRLSVIMTLVRMFVDEVVYAQGKEAGLSVGLVELDCMSYRMFAEWFDERCEQLDELAEYKEGGHEMSAISKYRGRLLVNSGVVTLSRIGTKAYADLPELHLLEGSELTYKSIKRIALPYLRQVFLTNMSRVMSLRASMPALPVDELSEDSDPDPDPTDYELSCALISETDVQRAIVFTVRLTAPPSLAAAHAAF